MRLSTRLLRNASTTYFRLGATFVLGLFTTWYVLGALGVAGFGLIALAVSTTGLTHAVERTLRFGLVHGLATALASNDHRSIQRSVASSFALCLQATGLLGIVVVLLATLAKASLFNTMVGHPELDTALAVLILGEGVHAAVRLLAAPYLQTLFAAQRVGIDNLLMVVARASHALSTVLIFGWMLPDASLEARLAAFAVSRTSIQLVDVALGIWLAKRFLPELRLKRCAYDEAEYRSLRSTVWHSSQVALLNVIPQLLAVLVNLFFGLAYNTIWQIAVQLSGFAWMFAEGLLRGLGPLTTHLQKGGQWRAVIELAARSIRYQWTIALPAGILLGLWARPLLELWVGARFAADANLSRAGISPAEALDLGSTMAVILLAAQVLRAGFIGLERSLYGMGRIMSYAWFSKWATLATVGLAAAITALLREPLVSPLVMLAFYALYSPGVVLRASRREMGLATGAVLRRSLPRPLLAGLLFFALLAPIRLYLDSLTLWSLGGLLIGAAVLYVPLALLLVSEPDERLRLVQMLGQVSHWVEGRRTGRD